MKSNIDNVKNLKIDNLNVKLTELKPKKISKRKYKVGDAVKYLLEQPKNVLMKN